MGNKIVLQNTLLHTIIRSFTAQNYSIVYGVVRTIVICIEIVSILATYNIKRFYALGLHILINSTTAEIVQFNGYSGYRSLKKTSYFKTK